MPYLDILDILFNDRGSVPTTSPIKLINIKMAPSLVIEHNSIEAHIPKPDKEP